MNPCVVSPVHTCVRVGAAERRYKNNSSRINEQGKEKLTCDRNTTEEWSSLHVQLILDVMVRRQYHWVRNKDKVDLVAFHGTAHVSLCRGRLVVVDNVDASR